MLVEAELKIFTLNCWGIPIISKNRKERMQAIAEYLATSQYDVVCLQEVWTDTDFNLIRNKIEGSYPFSHYFYSGVVGSGVCIFSKHQLQDVFFHQWSVNGYVHKLQHGDWFGGKGVGMCRLKVGGFNINIYSAHLHAEYNRKCDEYQAHRVLQAFDTAQFIQLTSGNADVVVLAGDLNTKPGDLAYRIILGAIGLTDAFTGAHGEAKHLVGTNEHPRNSYTSLSSMSLENRIDYVMYQWGDNIKVKLRNYCQPLPDRIPGCDFSYSDHEAICASLSLIGNVTCDREFNHSIYEDVLKESVEVCNNALKELSYNKRVYWFLTALLFLLLVLSISIDAPEGYGILIHLIRVIGTGVLFFTFIMATLWNSIECNAVIAGKLSMEISLKQLLSKHL